MSASGSGASPDADPPFPPRPFPLRPFAPVAGAAAVVASAVASAALAGGGIWPVSLRFASAGRGEPGLPPVCARWLNRVGGRSAERGHCPLVLPPWERDKKSGQALLFLNCFLFILTVSIVNASRQGLCDLRAFFRPCQRIYVLLVWRGAWCRPGKEAAYNTPWCWECDPLVLELLSVAIQCWCEA